MMQFEFATATRIVFGPGTLAPALAEVAGFGRRALLATGGTPGRYGQAAALLAAQGVAVTPFEVSAEPTIDRVEAGLRLAREAACDLVVAIGGGSVIDAAKAVAALLTNPGELMDYLEGIGRGRTLAHPAAPFVAVPTTAGTGAEVTRNAVLAAPAHRIKVSMRSPLMLPRMAVVDPELTLSLPPDVTAAAGMDALTQLLEAFVSRKANPLTDGLCREGLRRCAGALPTVCRDGGNLAARSDMALASLFSGLALANGGLGAVHGIAGPLGGWAGAPHGALCGRLLPLVFEANLRRLQEGAAGAGAVDRFAEAAQILSGDAAASADDGVGWLYRLGRQLKLPPLARFGVSASDLPAIADMALKASSMRGNPAALNREDIVAVLNRALNSAE